MSIQSEKSQSSYSRNTMLLNQVPLPLQNHSILSSFAGVWQFSIQKNMFFSGVAIIYYIPDPSVIDFQY